MKMSLTRVLNEIKLLDGRISSATGKMFISASVGNKPPSGYESVDEVKKVIKANYDSVKDLIKRRNNLKSLLTQANAVTKLSVAGEEMTIAQAIERKRTINLERGLFTQLNRQLAAAVSDVDKHNKQVEQNIDTMLNNAFGKDKKVTEEESNAIAVPYRKQHTASLVDPLGVREEVEKLEEFITRFESEVDFTLSEVNAKTEIDVE